MLRLLRITIAFMLYAVSSSAALADCDGGTNPCTLDRPENGGTYYIDLPEGQAPADGWPTVIFLHGWGGDGASAMESMSKSVLGRGYALITPDGSPDVGDYGRGWAFSPISNEGRDEGAFLRGVADDATQRFNLNRERMMLSGFSLGASMVNYFACETPDSFTAYAAVAGSFWRPSPKSCAGPVRLIQTQGWSDPVAPLEGRAIGDGLAQASVFNAMAQWREANKCTEENPDSFAREGNYQIRKWTDCDPASSLAFALHPNGHGVPEGWTNLILDWYEEVAAELE